MSHAPFNSLASPIKSKFKLITSQSSTNKNLTDNRLDARAASPSMDERTGTSRKGIICKSPLRTQKPSPSESLPVKKDPGEKHQPCSICPLLGYRNP